MPSALVPEPDPSGQKAGDPAKLCAAANNFCSSHLMQMSLLESEEKFRLIAENTSDGIVQFAADNTINYVSPAYLKQLGYSEAQELTRTPDLIYAIIHPQDRDSLFARIYAAIEAQAGDLLYS